MPFDLTFISYSHKDKEWLSKLQTMLKPLIRQGSLAVWADTGIQPGSEWKKEIEAALASARVAVLLVSRHFLASDFIAKHELPPLLNKAKGGGVKILWVYLSACLYEETEIQHYQAAHDISTPLDSLTEADQSRVLADICKKIKAASIQQDDAVIQHSAPVPHAIKGLRPFGRDDAEVFTQLQRERDLERRLGAIVHSEFRFGILSGESGCGKSSFLQAGLLPRLEQAQLSHRCVYVKITNEDPIISIRQALRTQLGSHNEVEEIELLPLLQTFVMGDPRPLVLLLDQFEQFFLYYKREEEREQFVRQLAAWYQRSQRVAVKMLICIRGDFSDLLIELQTAMGYSIGPGENMRLGKFKPEEAARIISAMAALEQLPLDSRFVEEVTREELANREDGLVSPVDLQILAWLVKWQKDAEERAFTRKAFHKLGGVEGLLERFLQDILAARQTEARKQTALKVLLGTIDLDRNARAGTMTAEELRAKLEGSLAVGEVMEAVQWLGREDIRLLTPTER
ncbi:MAG: TIR domain-containing protein, partial [Nitrospirales bacterium]|nr:TIR domain-containing protein [Nitrospirales bacterium]